MDDAGAQEQDSQDGIRDQPGSSGDEYDTDLETEPTPNRSKGHPNWLLKAGNRHLFTESVEFAHWNMNCKQFTDNVLAPLDDPDIDRIDVKDAGLSPQCFARLADCLTTSHHITHLDVSGNRVGPEGGRCIGYILQCSKSLRVLNASGNRIGDGGSHQIAYGIKKSCTVTSLDLGDNEFDEKAAHFLASALTLMSVFEEVNTKLRDLDLRWNHFRGKGAVYICEGIKLNKTIDSVNLSWNGFGYEGALAVSKMLQQNHTLLHLDISHNRINWQGALLISECLKKNASLQTLRIGGNTLTTTGCMDLIQACAYKHCGLRMLDAQSVPVVHDFLVVAASIATHRPFSIIHGDIVSCHDILGRRRAREDDPLQKLIQYMKDRMLRPTELFRSLDKTVTFNTNKDEIIVRLKNAGLVMLPNEYDELIMQLQTLDYTELNKDQEEVIYTDMVRSVYHKLWAERMVKLRALEHERKLAEYHKHILDAELKPLLRDATDQKHITIVSQADRYVLGSKSETGVPFAGTTSLPYTNHAWPRLTPRPLIADIRYMSGEKDTCIETGNTNQKILSMSTQRLTDQNASNPERSRGRSVVRLLTLDTGESNGVTASSQESTTEIRRKRYRKKKLPAVQL